MLTRIKFERILWAVLFGVASTPVAAWSQGVVVEPSMDQLVASTEGPVDARRQAFKTALLGRLKEIVDRGNPDDPLSVSAILDIPMVKVRSWDRVNKRCPRDLERAKQSVRRDGVRNFSAPAKSWINSNGLGEPGFRVNGVAINPSYTVAQHASFTYDASRMALCNQAEPIVEWLVNLDLAIENLPALACLDPEEIRRSIPGAKTELATDGISLVVYEKPGETVPTGTSAQVTRLEFEYQANSRCSTEVYLRTTHLVKVAKLAPMWR